MEKEDRDLLIRIDERQRAMNEKLDRHIIASENRHEQTQKDIKSINRWRYGVVGSWVMGISAWLKGGM